MTPDRRTGLFLILAALALAPTCGTVHDIVSPCDPARLDGAASATAGSIKAFYLSSKDLAAKIQDINGKFLESCNGMLTDLGLPTEADAEKACAKVHERVAKLPATAVSVTFTGGCEVDADVEASCQAACTGQASCDVEAHCDPGHLYGTCDATCTGTCDVVAPTVACSGSCWGECDVTAAVSCAGECSGTCGGVCTGTCDGVAATGTTAGNCAGKCVGRCDASCNGACIVSGGASCTGSCKGTCKYTPGSARCTGTCRGGCSVKYQAPRCDGTLTCSSDVNCQASCRGRAEATVTCAAPQAQILIAGDPDLAKAVIAHAALFGEATLELALLKDPAQQLANSTASTLKQGVSLVAAEDRCLTDALTAFKGISVDVQVSVKADATFIVN